MTENHYQFESCKQQSQRKRIRLSVQGNVFIANITIVVYSSAAWIKMQMNCDSLNAQKQQIQLLLLVAYYLLEFRNPEMQQKPFPTKVIMVKHWHACALHALTNSCVSFQNAGSSLAFCLATLAGSTCEITCNGLPWGAGKCLTTCPWTRDRDFIP